MSASQVVLFEQDLLADLTLADAVLEDEMRFPPVPVEPERVIRCSPENVERAVCRAFARCSEWGQFWKVESTE